MPFTYLAFAYVASLAMIAAYHDFRFMIIPNWISIAYIGGFVVFASVAAFSYDRWLWHIGISVLIFIVYFSFYMVGAMGGGDVKLLAATALWIGPQTILPFIFYVSLLGALLAIWQGYSVFRRNRKAGGKLNRKQLLKAEIPYGIAISIGLLLVFPQTIWIMS